MPADEDGFLKLAVRAGISYRERNQAWRQLACARPEPLTADRLAKAPAEARSLQAPSPLRTTALYHWYDGADLLLESRPGHGAGLKLKIPM